MDGIMPILAVVAIATAELDDFQRFPHRDVCQHQYGIAGLYAAKLDEWAATVGGWQGRRYRIQAEDARVRQRVWLAIWWVSWNCDRETREAWANTLREMIGDEAFYRGHWPGPLPENHFETIGIDSAKILGFRDK